MPLLRSQLIDRIWMNHDELSKGDVECAIDTILSAFAQQLEDNGRIEIRGFGSFSLHHRPSRKSRNPRTGESLITPEKRAVHFKCSRELLASINTALHSKRRGDGKLKSEGE